jgi:hypothetical protein
MSPLALTLLIFAIMLVLMAVRVPISISMLWRAAWAMCCRQAGGRCRTS